MLVHLRNALLSLALAPRAGGSIASCQLSSGLHLLRPASPEAVERGEERLMASYPLVPYSNRVCEARFTWGGHTYPLARNVGEHPHALHGNAWQQPWHVAEHTPARAVLTLEHAPSTEATRAAWPFHYAARQEFVLEEAGFAIRLELRSLDSRPFPAGIGHHPFFPRTPGVRLSAAVAGVWENDERMVPTRHVPHPGLAEARVDRLSLDNCFTGWRGAAALEWPEHGVRLTLSAEPVLGRLVVYTPQEEDFFCVEPVSHVNNGFNLLAAGTPDTGVVVLAPGEALAATVRFAVRLLA